MEHCIILGGGVTGLAAGYASGCSVYEARSAPGGICASYYVRPGTSERLPHRPNDGPAYRFEIGGGHWIFGGDPAIKRFIAQLVPIKQYRRNSAVYLPGRDTYVPYPLQNHLHELGQETAADAIVDMLDASEQPGPTMEDWLYAHFGETLCELFFAPFHELYTAGLWHDIAPQDPYKSPAQAEEVVRGALHPSADEVGYNVEFGYPEGGLDVLMRRLAAQCDVHYDKRATAVDVGEKRVTFADGTQAAYDVLISTLPLNRMLEMTGLTTEARPDPYTSVLVLNLGAVRGPQCPDAHWIYVPESKAGFHRVGFYSNVDTDFLPAGEGDQRVSIYVERAYPGGDQPTTVEVEHYADAVVKELQQWGYIAEAEVADPTWIDVAYTWSWPNSDWPRQALDVLDAHDILMVGRYGRWTFQGIADSLRDGLFVGNTVTVG